MLTISRLEATGGSEGGVLVECRAQQKRKEKERILTRNKFLIVLV
jgi:hypothetical protein